MIDYKLVYKDERTRSNEITYKIHDHCFGALTDFPGSLGPIQDSGSSPSAQRSGFRYSEKYEDLLRIEYILEGDRGHSWGSNNEAVSYIKKVIEKMPQSTSVIIKLDEFANVLYIAPDSGMKWDNAILTLTFFRNLFCYNGSTLKYLIDEGMDAWEAACISQFLIKDNHGDYFTISYDEEYAWVCAYSFGVKALETLITLGIHSNGISQESVLGGAGYMRDEHYCSEGIVFNSNGDTYDGNYNMTLSKEICFLGDTPLPILSCNNNSGQFSYSTDEVTMNQILIAIDNMK